MIEQSNLSPVAHLTQSPFLTNELSEDKKDPFKNKVNFTPKNATETDENMDDSEMQQKLDKLFKQNLMIQQQLEEMKSRRNKENNMVSQRQMMTKTIRNIELTQDQINRLLLYKLQWNLLILEIIIQI